MKFEELPDVLTPREAARFLRVGRNGIYEAIHRGQVPSFRIGNKILIPKIGLKHLLGDGHDLSRQEFANQDAIARDPRGSGPNARGSRRAPRAS